jgi:hypothetical protein
LHFFTSTAMGPLPTNHCIFEMFITRNNTNDTTMRALSLLTYITPIALVLKLPYSFLVLFNDNFSITSKQIVVKDQLGRFGKSYL